MENTTKDVRYKSRPVLIRRNKCVYEQAKFQDDWLLLQRGRGGQGSPPKPLSMRIIADPL